MINIMNCFLSWLSIFAMLWLRLMGVIVGGLEFNAILITFVLVAVLSGLSVANDKKRKR